jgi:GGDEF domain-containing protein
MYNTNTDDLTLEVLKLKIEKLEELLNTYMHDKLTGLLMRRDFDNKFSDLFEAGKPFYLTLVDVNGLHNVNRDPEQGYDSGDDLIVSVAHKLTMNCENVVYRIGGDEFAILSYSEPCHIKDKTFTMASSESTNFKSIRQMMKDVDDKIIKLKKEFYKGDANRRH